MNKITGIVSDMAFRFPRVRLFLGMVIVFILFSIVTVLITQSDKISTNPVGWENFRSFSPPGIVCRNVKTDRNGNIIAAVYEGSSGRAKGIYINVSLDGGGSFMPSKKITGLISEVNNSPCVAVSDSGEIRVMWYTISEDESSGSMFQSVSTDLGATWSTPEKISFGLQMEILPLLKYDSRNVLHLFFTAYRGKSFNLFHTVRNNDGKFGNPEPVAELKGGVKGAFFPAIKFRNSRAAVVWQAKEKSYEDSLYFVGSDDYGQSWTSASRITPPGSNYQAPSIEIVDGSIYLVFMNNSEKNWAIRMARSRDFGDRWDPVPLKVSTTNPNCYSPDISAGPGNELYIIWHDSREKGNRIFLRRYSLETRKFSDEAGLSVRQKPGRNASVVNTGRRIIVFWEEAGAIVSLYSDISAEVPVVWSSTHRENSWTRNTDAVIEWKKPGDESGVAGYATMVDRNPYTDPDIQNLKSDANRMFIPGLEDGVSYFHIRTVDGAGNMSRTVHYRLQVSSSPLSMPIVISTTHPENGKSLKTDAVFRWAVNDVHRLKGFVYSLSKDVAEKPDRFIEKFDIRFNNLEKGVYFFNLAAITTTNQASKVTTYCFIVGTEGDFNTDYMKDLANRDYDLEKKEGIVRAEPQVEILLPFGGKDWSDKNSFDAVVRVKNIQRERILGYSVVVDSTKRTPPERMNIRDGSVQVRDLHSGEYTIGARCRYVKFSGGRRGEAWTEPVYAVFTIRPGYKWSPLDDVYMTVINRIKQYPVVISVFMVLFTMSVVWMALGDRLVFYYRLVNFRVRDFLRRGVFRPPL